MPPSTILKKNGKQLLPRTTLIVLFLFSFFTITCNYFKVTPSIDNVVTLKQIQNLPKYIILHLGTHDWHLKNIKIDTEKDQLTGYMGTVSSIHNYYEGKTLPGANRFKYKYGNPTNEVHIYTSSYSIQPDSTVNIPLSAIKKIEVYDLALGATIFSHVFATVCVIAGVAVIIGAIAIATKSSCPFVYVKDSTNYHFAGELYGGAIYPTLERDDYMPLKGIKSSKGNYQLVISNELLEKQYTDIAEIITVEHSIDGKVLFDKNGNLQTISNPQDPISALSDKNTDCRKMVMKTDSISYIFNDESTTENNLNSLVLTFKKPPTTKQGKLILNTKNSYWLDFIYGKFNEQFGSYYNQFANEQRRVPAQQNTKWALEQGIPLSVYIQINGAWKFIDYFNLIGPLASRDVVMPIDLSTIKDENIKIKLECGFMFWEVDYAAMDFTENNSFEVQHLPALSAIDEKGKDVRSLLSKTDKNYLIQPEIGNEVQLQFPAKVAGQNKIQTCFLHSRGYYEYIRNYTGLPNLLNLYSFKEKGAFTNFSKKSFVAFERNKEFTAAILK